MKISASHKFELLQVLFYLNVSWQSAILSPCNKLMAIPNTLAFRITKIQSYTLNCVRYATCICFFLNLGLNLILESSDYRNIVANSQYPN